MTTRSNLPPRKPVTAYDVESMEENGDDFYVVTFHHGLGEMTRLDLDDNDVRDLVCRLTRALVGEVHAHASLSDLFACTECAELLDKLAPKTCAHCGRPIEGDPDNGGDPWYHPDTMSARCDGPDDEEGLFWSDLVRQAEPAPIHCNRADHAWFGNHTTDVCPQ